MPNTITAYNTFNANTKAKSSEVNTNFSNHRGHLIPIDPNTAAAGASNTYDNGTYEHHWRSGYFGTSVELLGLTSTSDVSILNYGNTTGAIEIQVNSLTAMVKNAEYNTTTVGIGGIAMTKNITRFSSTNSGAFINHTLTISLSGKRPVVFEILPEFSTYADSATTRFTSGNTLSSYSIKIEASSNVTTSSNDIFASANHRVFQVRDDQIAGGGKEIYKFLLSVVSASTYTFHLTATAAWDTTTSTFPAIFNYRMLVYEL